MVGSDETDLGHRRVGPCETSLANPSVRRDRTRAKTIPHQLQVGQNYPKGVLTLLMPPIIMLIERGRMSLDIWRYSHL